jgi:hypothetical protein
LVGAPRPYSERVFQMYLPSATESCNSPTSQNPGSPFISLGDVAALVAQNNAIANCDQAYFGVLNPAWQSFVSLGPQVAYQVLNTPIGGQTGVYAQAAPPSISSPQSASPAGVQVSSPTNPMGPNPSGGGAAPGRGSAAGSGWRVIRGGRNNGADAKNVQQFTQVFGPSMNPWPIVSGPVANQGTAPSLSYGGGVYNRTPQLGTTPPGMPSAAAGFPQGSCSAPNPVQVSISGEPVYNWAPGVGSGRSFRRWTRDCRASGAGCGRLSDRGA